MFDLNNLSYDIAGRYLFKNVTWNIKPGYRIGLIGKNGTGKSTLLKIIAGKIDVADGMVNKVTGLKIGYLSQDFIVDNTARTVTQVAMEAFSDLIEIEKKLKLLEEEMANGDEAAMEKWGKLQDQFQQRDGYSIQAKTEEILEGLGFKTHELNQPLDTFSGGWRMRAVLARILLTEPDLLLLDEPTNHLDLPSIEWLETYLKVYPGTVIVVSHDREFLNRMTDHIAEIFQSKLQLFSGAYEDYLTYKELNQDLQQKAYENQQQYLKQQERFIERFRSKASKATLVQSRIKQLEKIDLIEAPEEDLTNFNLKFTFERPSGKVIFDSPELSKSYGEKCIVDKSPVQLYRGQKVALIGPNGVGKTTLLRIIAGEEPFEGKTEKTYHVNDAFYAQHQLEALNPENNLFDEVKGHATHLTDLEVRTVLGSVLFSGEAIEKKIRVLSGGEKARVALAKTLVSNANLLLLDEPTNHLDIQSIEILINALKQYEGTLIFVSHNRYFIKEVAEQIWWLENEQVKVYPGNYQEFVTDNNKENNQQQSATKVVAKKEPPIPKKETIDSSISKNQVRQWQRESEELEKKIEEIDLSLNKLESQMNDPETENWSQISQEYNNLKLDKEKVEAQWEAVLEKLMEVE